MNILMFTFSGSGNTRWVAEKLGEILRGNGHTVGIAAIETAELDAFMETAETFDAIGFAQPIYAADIPRIMRAFIRRFTQEAPPAIAKTLFFINTFGYVNGHGFFEAKKLFRNTPFQLSSYLNIQMINSAPQKPCAAQNRKALDEARKQKASRKLEAFAKRLEAGKRTIQGIGPQPLAGALVRKLLRGALTNNYQRMHVDMQRCTRCMLCVRECPVQCIHFENETFAFFTNCEACMRCYHHCPVHAIAND